MKRRISGFVAVLAAVVCLMAVPAFAADNFNANKIGVGYQGILWGSMMNGLSGRYWIGPNIGVEANVFYGAAEVEADGDKIGDGNLWMINAKAMYAVLVRSNSKFYVGGQIAYGQYNVSPEGTSTDLDGTIISPGVFAGAEWCFPQLPELGFNFELGYSYLIDDNEVGNDDAKLKMHGMNLGAGIHYYF